MPKAKQGQNRSLIETRPNPAPLAITEKSENTEYLADFSSLIRQGRARK